MQKFHNALTNRTEASALRILPPCRNWRDVEKNALRLEVWGYTNKAHLRGLNAFLPS